MDIVELFRKLKNAIKRMPSDIKDSIDETDIPETINGFFNNKKNQKVMVIVTFFVVVILSCLIFNMYMSRYDGPTVKNLRINNTTYGNLTYSGEIENRKIIGNGLLTIIGNVWAIEYNGTFEKNDSIDDSLNLQIGTFTKGSIKIINLDSGNQYVFNGTFEDNFLKTGYIEKTINGAIVKYTGSFKDNKLNGVGEKYVMINGESKTFKGIFKDNKLDSRSL